MCTCFKINYVCDVGSGQNPIIIINRTGALIEGKRASGRGVVLMQMTKYLPIGSFRKQVGKN